jgi:hypothetical protein
MKGFWRTLCLAITCGLCALPACGDDDAPSVGGVAGARAQDGEPDAGGAGAGGSKTSAGDGGVAHTDTGAGGEAGSAGGARPSLGGAPGCDCRRDDNAAYVPLECACAAGWCTTFERDSAALPEQLGWPYYLLLGTCDGGYRRLVYAEALENGGDRTYDARGRMVYRSEGPYSVSVPDACGFEEPFDFGNLVIGEDPAAGCEYCWLAGEASGAGGASGAGEPPYPELGTPPCD